MAKPRRRKAKKSTRRLETMLMDAETEARKGRQDYKNYIRELLRAVDAEMEMSAGAVEVINSLLNHHIHRLASDAALLARRARRKTLASAEIRAAVRLNFPGDLARHALSHGTRAVIQFLAK